MSAATRDSWKVLPPPAQKEPLGFSALYTDADAETMMLGLIPQAMEDKWFIYSLEGWLSVDFSAPSAISAFQNGSV